jgi:hypothetical protein
VLTIATVVALGAGMAGVAFGDEPSTDPAPVIEEPTTTTTTAPADDPPDPCAANPEADGCTVPAPDVPPEPASLDLGALDVGALAAPANSITVTKAIQPGDATGVDFPVQLIRCSSALCGSSTVLETLDVVGGGAPVTFSTVLANQGVLGPRYRIVEVLPSGWRFLSVSCTGNGSATQLLFGTGMQFRHTTGTTWDCTFNNANNRVRITKQADASGAFDIRLTHCTGFYFFGACVGSESTFGPTSWQGGDSQEMTNLPTGGGFRIHEAAQPGWRLTGVSCTGGDTLPDIVDLFGTSAGVFFGLSDSNPTRDCTFVNTRNRITVTKATVPTGATGAFTVNVERCEFNVFALCLDPNYDPLVGSPTVLSDGQSADFVGFDSELFDRYFRVQESDPGGEWSTTAECTGQFGIGTPVSVTRGEAFTFSLNRNVPAVADCTITNTAEPSSLTIEKKTDPSGGGPFDFTLGGPSIDPADDFSLSDAGTELFSALELGDYTLTETSAPADEDWVLVNVDCVVNEDDSANDAPVTPIDNGGGSWTIPLGAGQDVTCTADNREASIALDITASPTSGVVGDTITFEYEVTNTGKVPLTNVTVVSDLFGPITLGTTDLGPGDSTTGTFDHTAVAGDVPQITDTATATADIDTGAIVLSDVGTAALDPVSVTATSDVTVGIAQVGGETVTRGDGTGDGTGDGALPFTGSDSGSLLAAGLVVLLTGLALGALGWRRRRSLLDA